MEQKTGLIYRAYDSEGKSYVGQTVKGLDARRKEHERSIANPKILFHKVLKEKGIDAFKWEILEDNIPEEQLLKREIYWAKYFDSRENGYNGKGRISCFPRRDKRKPLSEETKEKLRKANLGKHHSEETCKKISESNKGKPSPMKGKPSPLKGRHFSEEHKRKLSESMKGKSPGNKGVPMTEEQRKKLSKAITGKHWKLVDGKHVWY